MQKKQSTIRKAKTIGMLFMYLKFQICQQWIYCLKAKNLQAQKPREGGYRELNIHRVEMIMNDRQTSLNKGLEDALV